MARNPDRGVGGSCRTVTVLLSEAVRAAGEEAVREYVKLRRLARACESLRNKENSILNVAVEYGFGGRETFTRAFKDTYGITPAQYRDKPVGLMNYDKPDLSLNYRMVDEGVPLIGEGLVLEYNRRT